MPALRARRRHACSGRGACGREGSDVLRPGGASGSAPGDTSRGTALRAGLLAACLLLAIASLSIAAAAAAAPGGSDRFAAGAGVTERAPVSGDLFAAGGSVDVDTTIDGDAVLAGGTVRLAGEVGHSVYAAGGRLSLLGRVANNARLAGGQVLLEPTTRIDGNLTVTGGRIELRGNAGGSVGVAGGEVLIDATIRGDVDVAAGSIALGPDARIGGSLRYRGTETLQRDPTAQVAGAVERLGPDPSQLRDRRPMRWIATGLAVLWTIGLTLLAAIIVALLPGVSASVSRMLHTRPGLALLLGFAVLVCTPIAVVLSFVTVIGIPLGLFALLVYLMLLPLAWIASAIGIGDWFVARLPGSGPDAIARRVVATAIAVVLLAFLTRVPWVGGWIAFIVLIAGLGALALAVRRLFAR